MGLCPVMEHSPDTSPAILKKRSESHAIACVDGAAARPDRVGRKEAERHLLYAWPEKRAQPILVNKSRP